MESRYLPAPRDWIRRIPRRVARITHLASGTVVAAESERTYLANRALAWAGMQEALVQQTPR